MLAKSLRASQRLSLALAIVLLQQLVVDLPCSSVYADESPRLAGQGRSAGIVESAVQASHKGVRQDRRPNLFPEITTPEFDSLSTSARGKGRQDDTNGSRHYESLLPGNGLEQVVFVNVRDGSELVFSIKESGKCEDSPKLPVSSTLQYPLYPATTLRTVDEFVGISSRRETFSDVATALIGKCDGGSVKVSDVFSQAKALEDAYRAKGFIFARVVVPEQRIDAQHRTLRLVVAEGRISEVKLLLDRQPGRNNAVTTLGGEGSPGTGYQPPTAANASTAAGTSETASDTSDPAVARKGGGEGSQAGHQPPPVDTPFRCNLWQPSRWFTPDSPGQPYRDDNYTVEHKVLDILRNLERLDAVNISDIERYVLLAEDIPGVTVRPVLRPSDKEVGGVTMVVQVEVDYAEFQLLADNRGPVFAGPWQFMAAGVLQGCTGWGERIQITTFTTPGREQQFVQGNLEIGIGSEGHRVEVYGGYGDSHPGGDLDLLGYRGKLIMGGLRLGIPLVRQREWGIWFRPEVYFSNARINVDDPSDQGGETRQSESNVRALRAAMEGYWQPSNTDLGWPLLGRSLIRGELAMHRGLEVFGATTRTTVLASRVGVDENFFKATADLEGTFPLAALNTDRDLTLSLFGRGAGQYSTGLLLASEKFAGGGRVHGRGYYAGQVTGDQGISGTAELRLDKAFTFRDDYTDIGIRTTAELYGFYDYAAFFDNGPDDVRRRNVSSTGGGIRLYWGSWAEFEVEAVRRLELKPLGSDGDALDPWGFYGRILIKG